MTQTIGRRIAALRLSRGMTQERLAREVGVSPQAVSKWENDVNYPDITLLVPLSRLLGVTVDELLAGAPEAPSEGSGSSVPQGVTPTTSTGTSEGVGEPYVAAPQTGGSHEAAPQADETRAGEPHATAHQAKEPQENLTPSGPAPEPRLGRSLSISVAAPGERDGVGMDIPLAIVRHAARMGLSIPGITSDARLSSLDLDAIMASLEVGEVGTLIDLQLGDGDRVRVSIV